MRRTRTPPGCRACPRSCSGRRPSGADRPRQQNSMRLTPPSSHPSSCCASAVSEGVKGALRIHCLIIIHGASCDPATTGSWLLSERKERGTGRAKRQTGGFAHLSHAKNVGGTRSVVSEELSHRDFQKKSAIPRCRFAAYPLCCSLGLARLRAARLGRCTPKGGAARTTAARSRVGPPESVAPAAPSDPERR